MLLPASREKLHRVNKFLAEAKMTATMDHPHIVSFVGVAWDSLSDLCVVLEYMDGGELRTLLNNEMKAKLSDFGISRERLDRTMTAGVGTSLWMAPEVMLGERYDDKVDMFSFGVVLSELDVHTRPYARVKKDNLDSNGREMTDSVLLQKVALGQVQVEFSKASPKRAKVPPLGLSIFLVFLYGGGLNALPSSVSGLSGANGEGATANKLFAIQATYLGDQCGGTPYAITVYEDENCTATACDSYDLFYGSRSINANMMTNDCSSNYSELLQIMRDKFGNVRTCFRRFTSARTVPSSPWLSGTQQGGLCRCLQRVDGLYAVASLNTNASASLKLYLEEPALPISSTWRRLCLKRSSRLIRVLSIGSDGNSSNDAKVTNGSASASSEAHTGNTSAPGRSLRDEGEAVGLRNFSRTTGQNHDAGVGTSLWMAPEVMLGERYDDKADVFSFGVVLSELDVHTLPYARAKKENLDAKGNPIPDSILLQRVALGIVKVEFSDASRRQSWSLVERRCWAIHPQLKADDGAHFLVERMTGFRNPNSNGFKYSENTTAEMISIECTTDYMATLRQKFAGSSSSVATVTSETSSGLTAGAIATLDARKPVAIRRRFAPRYQSEHVTNFLAEAKMTASMDRLPAHCHLYWRAWDSFADLHPPGFNQEKATVALHFATLSHIAPAISKSGLHNSAWRAELLHARARRSHRRPANPPPSAKAANPALLTDVFSDDEEQAAHQERTMNARADVTKCFEYEEPRLTRKTQRWTKTRPSIIVDSLVEKKSKKKLEEIDSQFATESAEGELTLGSLLGAQTLKPGAEGAERKEADEKTKTRPRSATCEAAASLWPRTDMEKSVAALLQAGDLSDKKLAKDEEEELARKRVSTEEVAARQKELAKLRSLLFYEEQKQRRVKKIKSKTLHKIRNAQDKKAMAKQQEELRALDPELARKLDEELAEKRAEERLTLKHRNTSKWVKHQLRRGIQADERRAVRSPTSFVEARSCVARWRLWTVTTRNMEEDDEEEGDAASRLQKRLEKQASALLRSRGRRHVPRLRSCFGRSGLERVLMESVSCRRERITSARVTKESRRAKKSKNAKKKVVVTEQDKAAVDRALAGGALQTASVSMSGGVSARASGAIAIDLGDGGSGVALANGGKKQGKELELGVKTKEKTNPWLSNAATKSKRSKRIKKKTQSKGAQADVAAAIESLAQDTKESSKEDAGIATLTNGSKNSKKRKLDQSKEEPEVATKKKNKKAKKQDKTTAQDELVRRAFEFVADEEDELAQEKDRLASQDADAKKGAEIAKLVGMSGWGSWAGDGVRVSKRQVAREQKAKEVAREAKQKALAGRKDARLERVLINEKKDKKAAKFTVKDVPYPFTSRADPQDHEARRYVHTPLVLSKEDRKQAKKELSLKRKAKF
ncbi:Protein kinase-like domain [Phytophthora cactorum]|nr:Protein kinase-like domain [Phytophthora cactorum]